MFSSRGAWFHPRNVLTAVAAGALLLALAPTRHTMFLSRLGDAAQMLVTPVHNLFAVIFRPAPKPVTPTQEMLQSQKQLDHLKVRYLQLETDNRRLAAQIAELQRGLSINPDAQSARAVATVVGFSSNHAALSFKIRTDHLKPDERGRSPIGLGSVVVADGVNIVGRVDSPGTNFAWVRPINDPAAPALAAAIYPNEGRTDLDAKLWAVKYGVALTPQPDGTLRGSVLRLQTPEEPDIAVGMKVRLMDAGWPKFAEQLVVGTVTNVTRAANDRPEVTVKPSFDLRGLREVTIMIVPPGEAAEPKPTGGKKP